MCGFLLKKKNRMERGTIHICSRRLIFEPEKSELPLQKYFYKNMPKGKLRGRLFIIFIYYLLFIEIKKFKISYSASLKKK